jgi:signal transduction histidine kinase
MSEVSSMLERYRSGVDMSRGASEKISRVTQVQPSSGVLEALFDSIGRGVILTNLDGVVTYMNSAAEEMLHAERSCVIGKKIYMLPLRTPVYRVLSENCRDVPLDVAVMGRVYGVLASEVKNRQGLALGEMTEIWDITDQKKEKRQWEEFVAMITHDLKSPATVIIGYLQMLKMGVYGELGKKLGNVVEQMEQSGERLISMIEDLLEVYQLEMGNLTIKRDNCDIGKILEGAIRDNSMEAEDKDIDLKLSQEEKLQPVNVDEKQLLRVFNNLIGNAVKFTPRGGEVSVTAGMSGANLRVIVEDTGIGILQKDLARVFNKYFRSKAVSGYKGTGLGLAISRAIVEAHGGAISVESTEGKGSRFTVLIALNEE